MTAFFKVVNEDDYISGFGTNGSDSTSEISAEEYDQIMAAFHSKPVAPEGHAYMLKDGTLEWDLIELPPVPEEDPDPEEALSILLGGVEE